MKLSRNTLRANRTAGLGWLLIKSSSVLNLVYSYKATQKDMNAAYYFRDSTNAGYFVLFFAVPSAIQPIQNVNITEEGNVTLSCNVSGIPSSMVSWIKVVGGERFD